MIKNILITALASILFLSCIPAQVAPTLSVEHDVLFSKNWRVAVLNLNYEYEGEGDLNGGHYVSAGKDGGDVIAGLLASNLANMDNITIIEREKIAGLLEEQSLQQSGLISAESAIKVGKMAGAQAVIVGTLTDYVYWQNTGVSGSTISFSMRMIDVETGKVIINGSISRARSFVDVFPNAQMTTKELIDTIQKS